MKSLLKILITIVIIIAAGKAAYSYSPPARLFIDDILYRIRLLYEPPCSKPLTYSLGGFDAKFGVTKEYFLGALKEAEGIWENPSAKDLFAYDAENGRMKINLIYDYRQEASAKMKSLGVVVDNSKATYDRLDSRYDLLKKDYAQAKSEYDAAVRAFDDRQKAYQDKVQYWNKRGGAPRNEYDELEAEQAALKAQFVDIKAREARINAMVSEINALVVTLNGLANSLNLTVQKYNTIGSSLGESFEEGLYHTDGVVKQIDIYEFRDRAGLVRVLAHELGHSLDLDHVSDPKAIMYSFNQSANMTLTVADMAELKTKCGIK